MKWQVFGKTDRYDTSYRIWTVRQLPEPDRPARHPAGPLPVRSRHQQDRGGEVRLAWMQKWNASPDLLDTNPLANVLER